GGRTARGKPARQALIWFTIRACSVRVKLSVSVNLDVVSERRLDRLALEFFCRHRRGRSSGCGTLLPLGVIVDKRQQYSNRHRHLLTAARICSDPRPTYRRGRVSIHEGAERAFSMLT